jgi:hypothetical protein
MERYDRPSPWEGPREFRVIIARLLLVNLALSWGERAGEAANEAQSGDVLVNGEQDGDEGGETGHAAALGQTSASVRRERNPHVTVGVGRNGSCG